MGMSALSAQKEKLDCYAHLEHIIQTGDIDAVKKYIQDNNLTHAHYKKFTDPEWMGSKADGCPVTVAARCGNVDILNYLLSIGFSPKYRCRTTPMLEACKHGHIAVVKVLVELHGINVNEIYFPKSNCNETALSTAASAGQLEIVQYLLEMGASVEPAHRASMTPLRLAASRANGEILTALLNAGADIEGNDPTDTPFCGAVFCGKLKNANILYSKGANAEPMRKYDHCTPLEIAIQRNKYEMVRYLAVELNLPWEDNLGRCPLDMAFHHNRMSIIKLLIDAGFSSSVRTRVVSNSPTIPDKVISELNVFLKQTSTNPRTLKQMCCFKVRRLLGRNLSRVVNTLPLPLPLIDFVKLTHISLHRANSEVI